MPSPDPSADPEAEPYEVLGVDPTEGPGPYRPLSEIESHAKQLVRDSRDDQTAYRKFQIALKEIRERHPARSSNGVWRVPLQIEPKNPTVEVRSPITIQVLDFLGEPVEDATLWRDDGMRMGRTSQDGTEDIEITTGTGTVSITASKQGGGTREFVDAEAEITVERAETDLRFDEVPSQLVAGDTGSVRVVDQDGKPRQQVVVETETGNSAETDADGCADPRFDAAGKVSIVADRQETSFETFSTAETTVDVARQRVSLQFENAPDTTTVDQTERYRVTNTEGHGVQGVQVIFEEESAVTDDDGIVQLRTPRQHPGVGTVVATKPDTAGITFSDARTRVDVDARQVTLSFVNPPDCTDVVTTSTVRVVNDRGRPVSGATVTAGSASGETGTDGAVALSFEKRDLGRIQLCVKKEGKPGIEYTSNKQLLSIEKREISLNLRSGTNSPTVGDTISFTVVNEAGDPVSGVTLRCESGTTTTDASGVGEITLETADEVRVLATKDDTATRHYDGDSIRVSVERLRRQLEIRRPTGRLEAFNPVTFTVTDTDGHTVDGVVVDGDEIDGGESDENGEVTVVFDSPGEFELSARKSPTSTVEYASDKITLNVREPPESVNIANPPDRVVAGEALQLSIHDHRGDTVSSAVVRAVSRRADYTEQTDNNGVARLMLEKPGVYQLSVTHEGYDVYDETQVRVVE